MNVLPLLSSFNLKSSFILPSFLYAIYTLPFNIKNNYWFDVYCIRINWFGLYEYSDIKLHTSFKVLSENDALNIGIYCSKLEYL